MKGQTLTKDRDHLKSVHKVDLKWLNKNMHFKEKPYFGKPIDVQWKLAFLELFPEVPKDQVPSPCKSHSAGGI